MTNLNVINSNKSTIDDLNTNAWAINRKDPKKAIELSNTALQQSQTANYKKGIADALKTLGASNVWISNNSDALSHSFEALQLYKDLEDIKNQAAVNYNLGANFSYISDFDSAIKYYNKCYNLSKEINDELGMADGLNGVGTIYYRINENDKALEVLHESSALCEKHNNLDIYIKVLDGLGEAYYNKGENNLALEYYLKSAQISNELGNKQVEAFAVDGLGRTYAALNKPTEALFNFNKSLQLRIDIGFKPGQAISLLNVGIFYLQNKQYDKAIESFDKSLQISLQINSKEGSYKACEQLSLVYEAKNDFKNAIEYHKEYSKYKDDVISEKSNQVVKSVEAQNKLLHSQAEKAILEERAKELENFSDSLVLMSQVGQQIISSLSVETIVNTVYKNVNGLMDAVGFGIGLFKPEDDTIVFPIYIEGDETFTNIKYQINDTNRLTTICFNQNKEIIINNFETEIQNYIKVQSAPKAGKNVESIIYLPLTYKGATLGVITVQSFNKNAYTNFHLNIFKNIATYTAIALENAKLYQGQETIVQQRTAELQQTYDVNKKVSEIGREITSSLNLGKIFKKLHKSISEIMPADCFGVRIYQPETNTVEYKYEIEKGIVYTNEAIVPLTDEDNYTVWCIKNRKDIFLNDNLNEYQNYVKQIRVVSGEMPNSLLFTPMILGEKLIGVITVQSFTKFAYKPAHLDILKTLATYTATALENAYLYQYMEDKVKERTKEVTKQKEEIEQTFENTRLVSEIGKEISSTFSIKEIISKVYNSINKLMDATMFGIGIYNPETQQINFNGAIENGEILEDYFYDLLNIERPAIKCFTTQKEYVILNFTEEYVKKTNLLRHSLPGQNTESIIYVPITINDKKIGVITVQSFKANAYTDYHLQLLKNLAIYTAIAIDNASLYNNLDNRVKERTKEIKIAYDNTRLLSQIAEDISASLSVETINGIVYKNINKLMKADAFGIGIVNTQSNSIEFKGFIENNITLPDVSISLKQTNRLAVDCFITNEEIFISDYFTEYKKYSNIPPPVVGNDSASIIYLPIFSKENCIGVFTVQSFEKHVYTDYHLNLLRNMAVSIGIAIDNANLYQNLEEKVNQRTLEVTKQKEEVEKSYQNTSLLSKIGNDITSTFSVEEIIEKVYANVNGLMDATGFGIGVYRKDSSTIVFPLHIEDGEKFKNIEYNPTDTDRLTSICYAQNKEIVINDFNNEIEQYVGKRKAPLQGRQVESIIYLPLIFKEKIIGVITVQSFAKNAYTNYHVQILKNLAVYVAIAIDNAELYKNMEDRVMERTAEVVTQKELLEKNFNDTKLAAQITKDITSSLSVETIVDKVYQNVNKLMAAESFGIGIYNIDKQTIEFSGFIERNEKIDFIEFAISDKNRYAVWCFENEKEIIINDNKNEYKKYIQVHKAPIVGKSPESLVYLPLFTKEKKIGVLTVQSFTKNAYSDYHVNILKNIALSIAIALDNAYLYQNLEEKVNERTLEVTKQKAIIEEKNKDITDSIKYAKKIQQAVAPNAEEFNKNFTESFILYKPKDIVSGDFYWFEHFKNNITVFAAADCTGHGVPGAFMSLICSDIMYRVLNDPNVNDTATALNLIDEKLIQLIKKSSESSANDGMDIALCAYYKNDNKMHFSGAQRPLLLIRNGELIDYKPTKLSIGGHAAEAKTFELNTIDVQQGDLIYLLTDGYADQFGGNKGKKFKFKNLKQLILDNYTKPLQQQKLILDNTFESWKGSLEQVDDVCVIGIKI